MSGPWEEFASSAQPAAAPWEAFADSRETPTGFASLMQPSAFAKPEPDQDFWETMDVVPAVWDAIKGLGVTAPAAFYQLTEGLVRPDQYSDAAKAAFKEADEFALAMEQKTLANRAAGKSSYAGETVRGAAQSLGFSVGTMAAAIPAGMATGKAGAAIGAAIGGGATAPVGGEGAAPGAGLGYTIGFAIGAGVSSYGAAYRMAGAQFMRDSFNLMEKEAMATEGRAMTEQEKADAYEVLMPIAKNTAHWEAGPEAVGNAIMAGAGKLVFGKTLKGAFLKAAGGSSAKALSQDAAKAALAKVAGKVVTAHDKAFFAELTKHVTAGVAPKAAIELASKEVPKATVRTIAEKALITTGAVLAENATEAMTNIEQSADQLKAQAIARGEDPNKIHADWSVGSYVESYKEMFPHTLALMALMGGGATAVKGAATGLEKTLDKFGLTGQADALRDMAKRDTEAQRNALKPSVSAADLLTASTQARDELKAREATLTDDEKASLAGLEALFTGDTFDTKGAAALFNAEIDTQAGAPKAQAAPASPVEPSTPSATASKFTIGSASIEAKDDSPQAKLEAVFGAPSKGMEYLDEFNPADVTVRSDGRLVHQGVPLNRVLTPDGKIIKNRPKGEAVADPADVFQRSIPKVESAPPSTPSPASAEKPTGSLPKANPVTPGDVAAPISPATENKVDDIVIDTTPPNTDETEKGKRPEAQKGQVLTDMEGGTPQDVSSSTVLKNAGEAKAAGEKILSSMPNGRYRMTMPDGSVGEAVKNDNRGFTTSVNGSAGSVDASVMVPFEDTKFKMDGSSESFIVEPRKFELVEEFASSPVASTKPEAEKIEEILGFVPPITGELEQRATKGLAQASPKSQVEAANQETAREPASLPSRSRQEIDQDIEALFSEAEESGLPQTSESFRRALAVLRKERESAHELDTPASIPAPSAVRSEARVSGPDALRHIASNAETGLGTVVGDDTALGALEVNMPVVVEHSSGEEAYVRVVIGTHVDEKGRRVHTLSRPIKRNEVLGESFYGMARVPHPEKESRAAGGIADALLGPSITDDKAVATSTSLLQSVLARIAGDAFAKKVFATTVDNTLGHSDGVEISVNPAAWTARLRQALNGLSRNSPEADAIVEDWISEMESVLWHETRHHFLFAELAKNRPTVMSAMRSLIEHAKKDENHQTRAMIGQNARGRYAYKKYHEGRLANITDDEVMALLDGGRVNGVELTQDEINQEIFALGAEFDALFVQHLRSGMDPAAIRAASDRFISRLAGDPTKSPPGRVAVMLERFTELLRRGLEAASRFMNAHRLARTLPKSFLRLSLDLDQVMQGQGIITPDPARVIEKFASTAAQRMQNVAAVEEQLKSRHWFDGDKRVTEFDVKEGIRNLSRLAQEKDPELRPVVFDRVTGKLKPASARLLKEVLTDDQIKLLSDLLDRLNDPRRSATALEARQIATDTRLVLRNLNLDIPTTARTGADPVSDQDILGVGDFTTAAAILNENLVTEVEARTGFPVQTILDQINKTIANLQAPTPPPGFDAVHRAILTLGHPKIDRLESNKVALNEKASAAERDAKSVDGARKQKLLARAGGFRERALLLSYEQELIARQLERYQAPATNTIAEEPIILKNEEMAKKIRLARIEEAAAKAQYQEMRRVFASKSSLLRNFGDLADAGYSSETLTQLLSPAEGPSMLSGVDANQLEALLGRARAVRHAFARLNLLPNELQFMLLGGPRPQSMRTPGSREVWEPVGKPLLNQPAQRQLLPTNAANILWRGELIEGFAPDAVESSVTIDSAEFGELVFQAGPDMAEDSLEQQAMALDMAVSASARLMGYELIQKKTLSPGEELSRSASYRRNMSAVASDLVARMRHAMIHGDSNVSSSVLDRGGFPALHDITGDETKEDGFLNPSLMPIEDSPDVKLDESGKLDWPATLASIFDSGMAARAVLSVARFMDQMAGRGVHSPALSYHSDGFTPSGLAQAIITPRFLKFLALTKNTDFQARMRASLPENLRAVFDSDYASLVAGLEETSVMRHYRDGGNWQADAYRSFFNMREGMVMADVLYRESIHEASRLAKRGFDPESFGVANETRSPISEEFMRNYAFEKSQMRREANSLRLLGEAPGQSGVAISLLRPVAAGESLEVLDRLDSERRKIVLVRGKLTEGDYTYSDMRMMLEGSDQRENTDLEPQSDQMANTTKTWLYEQLQRHEERLMEREEQVITQLMLSLHGGNEQKVRSILNDREFVYYAMADGEMTRHWNRTAIREFLRHDLEVLRLDELARGVIRSDANGSRNQVFDETIALMMEEHEDYAAILRQIMITGGAVHSGTAPEAFSADALEVDEDGKLAERHDVDATSVLYGLLGKIKNVTIITGKANRGLMYGDDDTRIPSIAFIPDRNHPTLVVPFGTISPTTEEVTLAIESVLEWMDQYGEVDFAGVVKPIVDSFDMLNEPSLFSVRAGYKQALSNYLDLKGVRVLSEEDLASLESRDPGAAIRILKKYGTTPENLLTQKQFDARIESWTEGTVSRIRELLADGMSGLDDILNPDFVELTKEEDTDVDSPMADRQTKAKNAAYRKILARILTSPAAKELLIYTTFDSSAPQPSNEELAAYGDLIGFHSVRGLDMAATRDQMLEQAEKGLYVTNDMGQSVADIQRANDLGGIGGENLSILDNVGALIADDVSQTEMAPVVPLQAEWANAVLYDALLSTVPRRDPSAPMTGQKAPTGLTTYQARQMLTIFDPSVIGNGRPTTVDEIMQATESEARSLQDRFPAGWKNVGIVPGSGNNISPARESAKRYGLYSTLDPINGVHRVWEGNRIKKGALLFAELAGVEFEIRDSSSGNKSKTRYASVSPDLAAWEKRLADNRQLKSMLTTLDASGRPLEGDPEEVSVFEGMRRAVFADAAADKAFIKAEVEKSKLAWEDYHNLQSAIEATQQLIEDEYESLDAMLTWFDEDTAPGRLASDTVRAFISSREEVALDLSRDLVSNFASFDVGRDIADDPFSPRSGSLAHSENSFVRGAAAIGRSYANRNLGVSLGISDQGNITEDALAFRGRYAEHNQQARVLLNELSNLSPDNFSPTEYGRFRITVGMSASEAERRIANLTGFIRGLSNPEWLLSRVQHRAVRRIASRPLSAADDKVVFPASVQTDIVSALYAAGFKPGQAMTPEQRENYTQAVLPIIFNALYSGIDTQRQAQDSIKAKLAELQASAKQGDLKHASAVLRVIRATGYERSDDFFPDGGDDFAASTTNSLLRNRAIAEMLRGELREQANKSIAMIQLRVEQLERRMAPRNRFAAWRVSGYATLELKPGEVNGKRVDATDVEIARRVLDAYGLMWSKLYMNNYGKSDFAVGVAASEQAAVAADVAAVAGFGSMTGIQPGRRFRLVDGIIEPENALERISGVLRARRIRNTTPEAVLARLRRDIRVRIRAGAFVGGELSAGPMVPLGGTEESLSSMIERIRLGNYTPKEVRSFLDSSIESTKLQIQDLLKIAKTEAKPTSFNYMGRRMNDPIDPRQLQLPLANVGGGPTMTRPDFQPKDGSRGSFSMDIATSTRSDILNLRRRLRQLNQRLSEYEAGLMVENEPAGVSLFAPVQPPIDQAVLEADLAAFADGVMSSFSKPASQVGRAASGAIKSRITKSNVFGGNSPDEVTRAEFRHWLITAKRIQVTQDLSGIPDGNGGDLRTTLGTALKDIAADPNNPVAQANFYNAQTRAIAAVFARDQVDLWATGYRHTKSNIETSWFYRAMLHSSAKVAGVFAKSLEAQGSANAVRSILDKGSDGHSGKDRHKLAVEKAREKIVRTLESIPKDERFATAARGQLLAQITSHLSAHGFDIPTAKSLLQILSSAATGMARANLRSAGGAPASTLLGKAARKARQAWRIMHEKGFHQIDNQKVMLDMFDDVIPMLEYAVEEGTDMDVQAIIDKLGNLWGKGAKTYSDTLMGLFYECRKGLENILTMKGVDPSEFINKPLVPFVWSNMSRENYTVSDIKSMGEMLDPKRSLWMRSPFRQWDTKDKFDLLDFDGMTAPLRVMDDMLYRTMVAPAYDAVAAIVGDVSVSSDHFSQYAVDKQGESKSGYISEFAKKRAGLKLLTSDDVSNATSGALAVSNMIRDELANDMLGFSASSRAISLYRKIAITGLARKLFSFSQPIAQTISPVTGYLATNGKRGWRFVPIQARYLAGIIPGAKSAENAAFAQSIKDFIDKHVPAVAHRAADSNQMLQEIMQDARLDGKDIYRGAFLGAADGAVRPVLNVASGTVDLMAKASAKSLQYLIANPESWVIKPMLMHEIVEEINKGRTDKITLDYLLANPDSIDSLPRHIQAATVRVEQLFGTAERAQKGKLSQPSGTLHEEVMRSFMTTLAGHPISMAANSWAASRMLLANPAGSPEFREGLRILGMTISQNMTFVFLTAPMATFLISTILAALLDWDDDERQEWEGKLYGIDVNDDPAARRKKLSYWAMSLLGRNEDPYGYSWHKNEWTDEQAKKHDGYRYARIIKELINQAPVIGSLSSTTLGSALTDAGLKAADISPQSSVQQAGIILPEKWGFTGTAADPDDDTPFTERSIYLATKLWFNYLNDSNSAAFALDPLLQSMKFAANNPDDLDAADAFFIGATLLAPKPREVDRAMQRQYPILNEEFEALAPWAP